MALPIAGIPQGMVLYNGGTRCDMLFGPCSCGAWHGIRTHGVNDQEDIRRAYIFYFLVKGNKDGKSRV